MPVSVVSITKPGKGKNEDPDRAPPKQGEEAKRGRFAYCFTSPLFD
jgi:hypothetical protein